MWFKYTLVAILALGAISDILWIGEKREPLTKEIVSVRVVINAILIVGIVYIF